ncbi:hypothetical protein STEG23_034195 [Scotinomys teguina]
MASVFSTTNLSTPLPALESLLKQTLELIAENVPISADSSRVSERESDLWKVVQRCKLEGDPCGCLLQTIILHAQVLGMPLEMHGFSDAFVLSIEEIRNYHSKVAKFKISKSFSTLANNFFVILSKLQPSKDKDMFSISESAHRRFLLFRKAFKQMDTEKALVKAFGEVDILLTWLQNFYRL